MDIQQHFKDLKNKQNESNFYEANKSRFFKFLKFKIDSINSNQKYCPFNYILNVNLFNLGMFKIVKTNDLLDPHRLFTDRFIINQKMPIKRFRDLRNSEAHPNNFKNSKFLVEFDWKNNFIYLTPVKNPTKDAYWKIFFNKEKLWKVLFLLNNNNILNKLINKSEFTEIDIINLPHKIREISELSNLE